MHQASTAADFACPKRSTASHDCDAGLKALPVRDLSTALHNQLNHRLHAFQGHLQLPETGRSQTQALNLFTRCHRQRDSLGPNVVPATRGSKGSGSIGMISPPSNSTPLPREKGVGNNIPLPAIGALAVQPHREDRTDKIKLPNCSPL